MQVYIQVLQLVDMLQLVDRLQLEDILLLVDMLQLLEVFLHKAFHILLHPFRVLYILLLCKQYNLEINHLNALAFHFQSKLGIEPKVQLHNKDHHIIYNLLILLFLGLYILDKVDNVQE